MLSFHFTNLTTTWSGTQFLLMHKLDFVSAADTIIIREKYNINTKNRDVFLITNYVNSVTM